MKGNAGKFVKNETYYYPDYFELCAAPPGTRGRGRLGAGIPRVDAVRLRRRNFRMLKRRKPPEGGLI